MNIMNRLTLKHLRMNKKRTLVTILGIILSAAMMSGVTTLIICFQDMMIKGAIANSGNWHGAIMGVPNDKLPLIEEDTLTENIMATYMVGYGLISEEPNVTKKYLQIQQYDSAALKGMAVYLLEGRLPRTPNEIILSGPKQNNEGKKYQVGDRLILNVGTVEQDEEGKSIYSAEEEVTYTITGFMESLSHEYTFSEYYTGITYLDQNLLTANEKLTVFFESSTLNSSLFDHVRQLQGLTGAEASTTNNELLRYMGLIENDSFNRVLYGTGSIVILVIIIGSVALIYNTFSISVTDRLRQFGMLASVGATKRQIRRTVFFESWVLTAIGLPIGLLSGVLGIGITIYFVNPMLKGAFISTKFNLALVISWQALLAAALLLIITIFLSAYLPSRRAMKISPVEAIRQSIDIRLKGKKLRVNKLTKQLFGLEGELALKNLKRNRKQYQATLISLTISIILFVTIASFNLYARKSTEMKYNQYNYDASVSIPYDEYKRNPELVKEILGLEGIREASIIIGERGFTHLQPEDYDQQVLDNFPERIEEEAGLLTDVTLMLIDDASLRNYLTRIGEDAYDYLESQTPKVILVNIAVVEDKKLWEIMPFDIQRDRELNLTLFGNSEINVCVGGITDSLPMGINAASSPTQLVFIGSHSLLKEAGLHTTVSFRFNTDIKNLDAKIREIQEGIGYTGSLNIFDIREIQAGNQQMLMIMSIFVYGFITLITLIGAANIFNTISTNISLRRREFAMLKSVGMTPHGFQRMIHFESLFYGIKALGYGLPISVLVSYLLYHVLNEGIAFGFALPWLQIGLCVVGILLLVLLTMLYASHKVRKENIIDAIKAEII